MGAAVLYDAKGKASGDVALPEILGSGRVNRALLYQALVMYRACRRQGTVNTKTRKDVSGGGRKPYRQKGTGRARAGSTRSPLWHGGGVVFGPHPRDFRYSIPKKIRRAALRESLKAKCTSGRVVFLEELTQEFRKTKEFAALMKALPLEGKVLALLEGSDGSVLRVSRNIPRFRVRPSREVNAYDVMRHRTLLMTRTALESLMERVGAQESRR